MAEGDSDVSDVAAKVLKEPLSISSISSMVTKFQRKKIC